MTILDVCKLVSEPFTYAKFCGRKNVGKLIVGGIALSSILAVTDITHNILEFLWLKSKLILGQFPNQALQG